MPRELVARAVARDAIGPSLLLIAGDELGPLGGLPGSDSLMLIPETRSAASRLGRRRTHGSPAGVKHLSGGPDRFCALLADQLERRLNGDAPDVHLDPAWSLTFTGIDHTGAGGRDAAHDGGRSDRHLGRAAAQPSVGGAGCRGRGVVRGEGPTADLLEAPRWERLGPRDRRRRTRLARLRSPQRCSRRARC